MGMHSLFFLIILRPQADQTIEVLSSYIYDLMVQKYGNKPNPPRLLVLAGTDCLKIIYSLHLLQI